MPGKRSDLSSKSPVTGFVQKAGSRGFCFLRSTSFRTFGGGNIAISGGNVTARSYYTGNRPSCSIGPGSGSDKAGITLSWTNESDSIDAQTCGGHVTLLRQFMDNMDGYHGEGTEFTGGKSEMYGEINGLVLTPGITRPDGVGGSDEEIPSSGSRTWIILAAFALLLCIIGAFLLLGRKRSLKKDP